MGAVAAEWILLTILVVQGIGVAIFIVAGIVDWVRHG